MKMAHTLIIGGTKGTGRRLADLLADKGHKVSVIGRTLDPNNKNIDFWALDLLDKDKIKPIMEEIIKQNGELNNLIFMQRYRGKENNWEGEIGVSLTATKEIIESLSAKFKDNEEKCIVIVSSIASQFTVEGQPLSYHIAKASLNTMVDYYAVNLGKLGIRVNAVLPATIIKEESKDYYLNNKKLQKFYKDMVPLGRMITSDDVSNTIIFLCSQDASCITGQKIVLDGGLSLIWQESLAQRILRSNDTKE